MTSVRPNQKSAKGVREKRAPQHHNSTTSFITIIIQSSLLQLITMHEFLPILQQAFPTASGCNVMASVVQANAEGHKISFQKSENDKDSLSSVFIKRVDASNYEGKSWPDFRRTLMYLRTEILFYTFNVCWNNDFVCNTS